MKDKYIDLIEQTFDFPQDEFSVEDNELNFHDIPLMELIKQYGTPLKITYLPKISQQINRAKRMFNVAMAKVDYKGSYNYCYCTKSSHFSFVLEEAMKNDIHLETSSAYDIHIINALYDSGIIDKDRYIICNGFKRPQYVENIAQAENIRKMLIAMANDIRVIIIKLTDRLHNMRTISCMPEQSRRDKAHENMQVYACLLYTSYLWQGNLWLKTHRLFALLSRSLRQAEKR